MVEYKVVNQVWMLEIDRSTLKAYLKGIFRVKITVGEATAYTFIEKTEELGSVDDVTENWILQAKESVQKEIQDYLVRYVERLNELEKIAEKHGMSIEPL